MITTDDPTAYPRGTYRTTLGRSIGWCSGRERLFSSDTAFDRHRRRGGRLDPRGVGLVARPSRTGPGEWIWGNPSPDREFWRGARGPEMAEFAVTGGPISAEQAPEVPQQGRASARPANLDFEETR